MRTPRDEPVTEVDGIGQKRASALWTSYRVETTRDLLYFYPSRYADRSQQKQVSELKEGEKALVTGVLTNLQVKGRGDKRRLVAVVKGKSGAKMEGVWFRGISGVRHVLKRIGKISLFGEASRYGRRLSMSHPEFFEGSPTGSLDVGRIVPLTASIPSERMPK